MTDEPREELATAEPAPSATGREGFGAFVPVLLVTLALAAWMAFQTVQLTRERAELTRVRAAQETPLQQSSRVRAQVDSLARKTAELATQGNANAQLIVQELGRRGITIDPSAPPVPGGPATPAAPAGK
jgi:hypothetical protein